jgi:lipopolysaccharide/colanic/teichoic acid biosynthesis glycosyltransferase
VLDGVGYYELITGKIWLESLALELEQPSEERPAAASPFLLVGKRLASVALSLGVLALAAPVMALIALAIRLDSEGPVIFRQKRVGQNGQLFTLYKFRSMRNGNHGPFRPAQKNDQRFTRLGGWLRRTRLDELPQLWNILRGDMSFVGPRPFAWEEEKQLVRDIPFYSRRWSVKPGVTGWAQIQRGYCATLEDNIDKLAYDLFYIKNLSLGMDLLILFQTTKILLQGRGAR